MLFHYNTNFMLNKKKLIGTIAVAAMAVVVSANVVTAIQQEKDVQAWESLMGGELESLATGESGDGDGGVIYYGAKNQYCKNPSGVQGCSSSTNPTHYCTLGIFCIEPK